MDRRQELINPFVTKTRESAYVYIYICIVYNKALFDDLGLEKWLHPTYFSDFTPSDYHGFRVLQNHLDGLRLIWRDVKHKLVSYFASKPKAFYKRDIYKFVDRFCGPEMVNQKY